MEIIDFLVPVMAVVLLLYRKHLQPGSIYWMITAFGGYILLTMLINQRLGQLRDYFEIFKICKFLLVLMTFSLIDSKEFLKKWIKPIFFSFVVLNLAHYYNLFDINSFLNEYYLGNERYSQFGLDSTGNPTYKRMLGFAGNPNNNAIIFLIFAMLLIPKKNSPKSTYLWFSTALVMMFLCQSRTAMICLAVILVIYLLFNLREWRITLRIAFCSVVCFGAAFFVTTVSVSKSDIAAVQENIGDINDSLQKLGIDPDSLRLANQSTYLETVLNSNFINSSSMMGRYQVWKHLWGMIEEKPIFGHAPHKEYFYENNLYPENEYILMTWRYGFIGLICYLGLLGYLFVKGSKYRGEFSGLQLMMVVVIMAVTGLTNNPFMNKTILVLFAFVAGAFFADIQNTKPQPSARS